MLKFLVEEHHKNRPRLLRLSRKIVDLLNFFKNLKNNSFLTWAEVSRVHKVRNGIYQRSGKLISLLTDFGKINECYPDFHGETEDMIFYTGAGRRGDQQLNSSNRAMFDAIETKHAVPLFNKQRVGGWEFLGFWTVEEGEYIYDEAAKRMIWKFKLVKSE